MSRGVIPVALLTTPAFSAAAAQLSTLRFGAHGTEASPVHNQLDDVDGDGDQDLLLHFRTEQTKIGCGATTALLTGKAVDGRTLRGADAITTVGCR